MARDAKVWACDAMINNRSEANIRFMPINPDVLEPTIEELEQAAAVVRLYKSGDLGDPRLLPQKFSGPYMDSKVDDLPDFFSSGPYLLASRDCVEVFSRFDLGRSSFSPVEIFQGDRKAIVSSQPNFILNIREKKSAFAADKVDVARFDRVRGPNGPESRYWPMSFKDDLIVLHANALEGCDLWFDTDIAMTFFLSSRLVNALRESKLQGKMFFKSCQIHT